MTGLRLKGEVTGTERERGLCRALTGAGAYNDRRWEPKGGKEERKLLDPPLSPSSLAQPIGSQRACVAVEGIQQGRGQARSGSGDQRETSSVEGSELWLETH